MPAKRFVGYVNSRLVGEGSTSFCAPSTRRKAERARDSTRQRGRRARETGSARRASRPTAARQQHVYVLYINVCSTASNPFVLEVHALQPLCRRLRSNQQR